MAAAVDEEAEGALWGEYFEEEEEDVRRATIDLVHEWRAHGKEGGTKVYDGKGQVGTPKLVEMARNADSPSFSRPNSPSLARARTMGSMPMSMSPAATRPLSTSFGDLELLPGNERSDGPS